MFRIPTAAMTAAGIVTVSSSIALACSECLVTALPKDPPQAATPAQPKASQGQSKPAPAPAKSAGASAAKPAAVAGRDKRRSARRAPHRPKPQPQPSITYLPVVVSPDVAGTMAMAPAMLSSTSVRVVPASELNEIDLAAPAKPIKPQPVSKPKERRVSVIKPPELNIVDRPAAATTVAERTDSPDSLSDPAKPNPPWPVPWLQRAAEAFSTAYRKFVASLPH